MQNFQNITIKPTYNCWVAVRLLRAEVRFWVRPSAVASVLMDDISALRDIVVEFCSRPMLLLMVETCADG